MMTAEQLKDSILLLAMQGKLETKCSSDEPISSVLKKIYAGKGRINPIDSEQIPYDLPENWQWARLEDITDNCDTPFADGPFGSNLKREHYTENHEVRIIQLSNIGENGWKDANEKYTTYAHLKTIERSKVNAGDIVIAKMMPAGRAIEVPVNDYAYVLSSDAVKFVAHPMLNKRFLLMAINSPVFREQVYSEVHGVTRVRTSLKKLKSYIVPLPPLAEQKRIVAKIEELMPFVEQYAATSTKLNTLNATFPEMMKKSILQEAVQGKLVPQDPNDEPASVLLEKIAEEKKRLIKEGKIKKQKPLPEITEDEIPFDIPESWEWVRVNDVLVLENGDRSSKYPKETDYVEEGIPFFGARDMVNGEMDFSSVRFISKDKYDELGGGKLKDGDLVCLLRGSVGKIACFYENEHYSTGFICAQMVIMRLIIKELLSYIQIMTETPYYQKIISSKVTGTAVRQLPAVEISKVVIPIPPLQEQKRIVSKVHELMLNVIELTDINE